MVGLGTSTRRVWYSCATMDPSVAGIIAAFLSSVLASIGTYLGIRAVEREKAEDEARQKCILQVVVCRREAGHLAGYLMDRDIGIGGSRQWTERYRHCWQQFHAAITELEKLLVAAPDSVGRIRRARMRMAAWRKRTINFEDDVRGAWGWLPSAFHGCVPAPDRAWQIPPVANHDVAGLRAIEEQIRLRLPRKPNDTLPEPIQQLLDEKVQAWQRALAAAEDNFYNELIGSIGSDRRRFTKLLSDQIPLGGAIHALARMRDEIANFDDDLLWLAIALLDVTDELPLADPIFDKLCDLVGAAYQRTSTEDSLSWIGTLAEKTSGDSGIVGMLDRAASLSMPGAQVGILRDRINEMLARVKNGARSDLLRKRQALRILKWWHGEDPASACEWASAQLSGRPADAYGFLNVFRISALDDSGEEQISFDLESAVAFVSFERLESAIERLALGSLAPEDRSLVVAFRRASPRAGSEEPEGTS